MDINFTADGNKIRLLIAEVFLCAAAGEESAGLDAAQHRPPPAILHGGRNPPQGVRSGRAPEDFCLLRHKVGEVRGNQQRVRQQRQQKQQRQQRQRGGRRRKDDEKR